jgi:transcription initiation factor TFIID subunit 9
MVLDLQLLEFCYRYMTTVLDDAKMVSAHAKKKAVDTDDIKLAVQV